MGDFQETDIASIRKTWAKLMENVEDNGVLIVKTFLDRYDYYSSFVRFRDFPRETIEENKVFRAHCTYVMRGINDIVANLHQPEAVRGVLEKLGQSHGKRNITKTQFENLIVIVLELLIQHFQISQEEQDSWSRVLNATFAVMIQNL